MDPIADLLVRVNNAIKVKKEAVEIPHSKVKEGIIKILQEEGFLGKYDVVARMNKKVMKVALKYNENRRSTIVGVKRVSTPGRRVYVGSQAIPRIQSGFGLAIISTPKGLMTDDNARRQKIGGEVLCYVW
ncbi:30S ribosomal protein S8 [candidate division WOR-1 bacterium RIFOXYA12_FULL_52_29]|uniref:Small ribosomal subunit protein uS8 n=1 Tax=candidate division WOR-1 bacterium RIFOXYC12_FULL_54_18 TaxID=1802584 RepID=A0A1F4T5I2_UNCSA|nr:MAG: 30S ribosomal protein S8 [candidate division WOR-1 bacterium RIFOXYA2_FULL_51_19]OGC17577.1 MAG: 30S ribosomal protein S8 [candidate division WOR-1 bacterium RIFOXYA12_FULL_52_29]OGC26434.1 MAG: 30S ribosomal protein S8 [candidate division WOR-1 bacterium RIFOXYB2_FULL_45_9]OGC27994.1 MAG: 30S ribosomal protein S8 [candidate division WOR-1 bacterium RIFOXYC12_FULL_54_18]OGC29720.1 MAG: 30S ribosomal protein S8 [candidate division WOR-1 bacterium RIFOXYB12_FULL_52_16]